MTAWGYRRTLSWGSCSRWDCSSSQIWLARFRVGLEIGHGPGAVFEVVFTPQTTNPLGGPS